MIKILTIIGARPQIIKAAALSRAITNSFHDRFEEILVHTGQHYDNNMSGVFFREMGIPGPAYNLETGSDTHGKQTGNMIIKLEQVLIKEKPDIVILYGDTNSTLAGALAASKLHIPIAHIEAGLRSFNKSMPEEINRIVCDHCSTLLFTPTQTGLQNLIREGFNPTTHPPFSPDNPGVFHCGDIMFDNSLFFAKIAQKKSGIIEKLDLENKNFILATIHRDSNTDNPEKLTGIFSAMLTIAQEHQTDIILPLHPRTAKAIKQNLPNKLLDIIKNTKTISLIPPVPFLDIIMLEKHSKLIMTDSGGLQKEAYFFNKPVIVLRNETEWTEIIQNNTGILTGHDKNKIIDAFLYFTQKNNLHFPPVFGNGKTAEFICNKILTLFSV